MGSGGEVSSALLLSAQEVIEPDPLATVPCCRREVVHARIVHEEGLSPFGEDVPPGIANSHACENPQVTGARVVLIDPAVVVAHHPVGRFHLRMQEDAFLKIDPTSRSPSPGTDRMVAVFDAKTGQGEFLDVRDVVTVRILQKENVRGLRDEASSIGQFDSRWHVQAVGKDG